MTDIINQIVEIGKSILLVFDTSIWPPLVEISKSIGDLFVKVLELAVLAVKWLVAKV